MSVVPRLRNPAMGFTVIILGLYIIIILWIEGYEISGV